MERWSSRFGFLLAAVGAAVGLGNIWRFPAVVGQNGGGAYLLPYLLSAFLVAVPLLVLEFGVGRSLRVDVVSAFGSVSRRFGPLGWIVAGAVLVVLSYYLVLTGWVLGFAVAAAAGVDLTFAGFTDTYWPVVAFLVVVCLTGCVVTAGVRSGIERLSKIVIPIVFLALILLAGYAVTLPGVTAGLDFFLSPDLAVLGKPVLWGAAIGQVFFSLSVGQGIMLTYGTYLDEEVDLLRSALIITVADVGAAMLAGVVVFPIVFTFGLSPAAGTDLAFSTLPRAFGEMAFGRAVALAFFGLLFFAALSSAISLLEVGVATVTSATDRPRRQVAPALTGAMGLAGLPSALSYSPLDLSVAGGPVLDVLDDTVGELALPVTALAIALVFGWGQPRDRLVGQLGDRRLVPLVRYLVPPVLVVVASVRLVAVV